MKSILLVAALSTGCQMTSSAKCYFPTFLDGKAYSDCIREKNAAEFCDDREYEYDYDWVKCGDGARKVGE